jgi:hypothetical protein
MSKATLEELNELKRQYQEKAQAAIKAEFRTFFEQYPDITSVVWTQYTPYFNDGDECIFGMHEMEFKNDGETSYSYGEDCVVRQLAKTVEKRYDYNTRSYLPPLRESLTEDEQKLVNAAADLRSLCYGLKENMKIIFGDHVQVVATRDGFDVSEYNHD